jgi:hypothetical protein
MVVINHGFEDLCPIGLAQSGDVGFKINHLKAHVPDNASQRDWRPSIPVRSSVTEASNIDF